MSLGLAGTWACGQHSPATRATPGYKVYAGGVPQPNQRYILKAHISLSAHSVRAPETSHISAPNPGLEQARVLASFSPSTAAWAPHQTTPCPWTQGSRMPQPTRPMQRTCVLEYTSVRWGDDLTAVAQGRGVSGGSPRAGPGTPGSPSPGRRPPGNRSRIHRK